MSKRVYIAGPMRGYECLNFPAFDTARDLGRSLGFEAVSPADIDRENGIDETSSIVFDSNAIRVFAKRDVEAILSCDAIALLPGWEKSKGANAEIALAKWIGLEILDARDFKAYEPSILQEAHRITRGDRNEAYGSPDIEHDRIAGFWSTYLNLPITGEQVAMMMVLLKVARMGHAYRRDNLVDIAGYADCCERIVQARKSN